MRSFSAACCRRDSDRRRRARRRIGAGMPHSVPVTTVNKVCGSGMRSAMFGCDAIRAGSARIVVAGGFESMTNAPYLLPKARQGYRMGHGEILDHMFYDGLQNPYDGQMMGHFADATAKQIPVLACRSGCVTRPNRCGARRRPATAVPLPPRSRRSPSRAARASSWWSATSRRSTATSARFRTSSRHLPRMAR